jgi:myo-inositol-1(or 4)-monophosphatase
MASMALRAGRLAAQHIVRGFDRPDLIKVSEKGKNDPVTNLDKDAERIIIESLLETYPHHAFLGEEDIANVHNPDADYQWIIDPIDGTYNFVRNLPHFCISIACVHKGKIEHGVIIDPVRQEEFVASRGYGCRLNDKRVRVSELPMLDGALISTGLAGSNNSDTAIEAQGELYTSLLKSGTKCRQNGSAALDLARVAAGRLDAFCLKTIKLWDMAAGVLMVTEAGGMVGDYQGGANHLKSGEIIAASPKVFKLLTQKVLSAGV